MALPSRLGNTHNLAAWKKFNHKKDEKLGDNLKELDLLLGQWAHGASESTVNRLITACERVSASATRVANQLKLPDGVEDFCEKLQYITEGLRKEAIAALTHFQKGDVENNRKMNECVDAISAHEKRVDDAFRQLSAIEKSSERALADLTEYVTEMKRLVGSVESDGSLGKRPRQWYDQLIMKECVEPIQANAAQAKTIYDAIQPAQAKYRGNTQLIIDTVGLTDPACVEKVKKIISAVWARVNKTAIAYETSYKKITTIQGEAGTCKTLAKKYLAEHEKNVVDQEIARQQELRETAKNLKFLKKATTTLQQLHNAIHEKCFIKTDFEMDYLQRIRTAIDAEGRNINYDTLNSYIGQNKHFQTILATKLNDAKKLIAEARKVQKLVISNIELTKETPDDIKEALEEFTRIFVSITQQERDLVAKGNKAFPSLAAAIELIKKTMQKVKN